MKREQRGDVKKLFLNLESSKLFLYLCNLCGA